MARIASKKDAVSGPEQAKTWGKVSKPVPIDLAVLDLEYGVPESRMIISV